MPKPLRILKASAGSGKTFSLAAHYLTLLFGGNGHRKYREILAVTFTNKATAEMKGRILTVLEGFARGDVQFNPYKEIVLKAHPQLSETELKTEADKIYRQLLHDYSHFSVSTIDGFVQKVIRGFTFELNLNSGYNLEMNYDKVKNELAERLEKKLDQNDELLQWIIELALDRISNNTSWNYKKELLNLTSEVFKTPFQAFEQAVNHFGEDAGELFKTYIRLTKEVIATFEENIIQLCKEADEVYMNTAANAAVLNGTNTKCLINLKTITNGDVSVFPKLESVFKLIDNPGRWFKKDKISSLYDELNPKLAAIQAYYSQQNKHYILAQAFYKNAYFLRLMQEMADILKEYRTESESLLISDAQKLLNGIAEDSDENPSFVWEKMGNVYRNFLFDEFQDTSADQWNSFRTLLNNAISIHDGKQNDHLVVGDTKQAIYRWRDGDYKLLHQQVKTDVGIYNVLEESLQDNRRSTEEIIDFNNKLYAGLPSQLQENVNNLLTADDEVQRAWHDPLNNFDTLLTDIYADGQQQKHEKTKTGGKVIIKRVEQEQITNNDTQKSEKESKNGALLREMVAQVETLIEGQGYEQREIGVLVRSNSEAAQVVETLMAVGRDVISGDALKIANNTAVKLIINVLHLLNTTKKYAALYKANCIALYAKLQKIPVNADDFLGLNETPIENLSSKLPEAFCAAYHNWLQMPVAEITERIIAEFIVNHQDETEINPHLPYLFAFRDLCSKATAQGEKGISTFLNWWEEEGQNKNLPSPETANAIQVMTIHKSKGLAFRAVLVPFCNWPLKGKANVNFWVPAENTAYHALGSIPLSYSGKLVDSAVAKHYLTEVLFNHMDALNTLYVATTRAIDFLYLGIPAKSKATLTTIGDAVFEVLTREKEKENDAESTVSELEFGVYRDEHQPDEKIIPLQLSDYPVSNRLQEIYSPIEEKPLPYLDNLESSGKKGEILHRILSSVNHIEQLDTALNAVLLDGLIIAEEIPAYREEIVKVLSSPDLKRLLAGDSIQLNEKAIITTTGRTKRPDKIIINNGRVNILDYKFTATKENKHKEQLIGYKQLLQEMGYGQVNAYLYYAHNGRLEEVK